MDKNFIWQVGEYLETFADLSYIPKSTLYDNFCAIKDPDLYNKFRDYMTRHHSGDILDKGYDLEDNSWKR